MKNRIKGTLPNLLTLINLSLGVLAILLAVSDTSPNRHLFQACLLVMIAALTDRFDGKVARMLDATSELGKELDSLSDLISFGVAPVIIAWKISFFSWGMPGYLLVLLFPMAGAYRLARYNITSFDNVFRGVPITIAGSLLAINNLYNWYATTITHKYRDTHSYITAVLIVLLSYLMVSKIKIKKL